MAQYIIVADIVKAYDNVDLTILDNFLCQKINDPLVRMQWNDELADLKTININVNGEIIQRTKGLPQGSKLGPLLFNMYTEYILSTISNIIENNNAKLFIYADNWVILFTVATYLEALNFYNDINNKLKIIGMNFETPEVLISRVDRKDDYSSMPNPNWSLEIITKELQNFNKEFDSHKLLGWPLVFYKLNNEFCVSFKGSELLFELDHIYSHYWNDAIQFWIIRIISKFKYKYEGLYYAGLFKLAELYKLWFVKSSYFWLKKYLVSYEISYEFIYDNLNGIHKPYLEYWRKYQINEPIKGKYDKLVRLQSIANYLLDNNLYAGIYHVMESIDTNRFIDLKDRFKLCTTLSNRGYARLIKIFEVAYMAILRDKSLLLEAFQQVDIRANNKYSAKKYHRKYFI